MRPVNEPAALVPDVLAPHADHVADLEQYPWSQVDVVRHEQGVAAGQLDEELLMA